MQRLGDFFGTDEAILAEVRAVCSSRSFDRGALVIGEGDEDDWVGIILEGQARVLRYSVGGTEVIVSTIGAGGLFGEMRVISGGPRSADIYALTDLQVATIPGPVFLGLLQKHPSAALALCQLLAERVEATTRRLFEEITLTSRHKIVAWLLREATADALQTSSKIAAMPSISDLARQLNLARETVSRTISGLKEEGTIQADGHALVLLDRHRLVSLLAA